MGTQKLKNYNVLGRDYQLIGISIHVLALFPLLQRELVLWIIMDSLPFILQSLFL